MNDSSEVAGIPISARDRHVTASSNQTFSTKVACFTRPSNVVREGTSDRRACSSLSLSRQPLSSLRCSSRNASNWTRAGWSMTSSADVAGRGDMSEASQDCHPQANQRSPGGAAAKGLGDQKVTVGRMNGGDRKNCKVEGAVCDLRLVSGCGRP